MGVLFIVMGIFDLNSKNAKPFGFWANAEVTPIEDVKGYNRANVRQTLLKEGWKNYVNMIELQNK